MKLLKEIFGIIGVLGLLALTLILSPGQWIILLIGLSVAGMIVAAVISTIRYIADYGKPKQPWEVDYYPQDKSAVHKKDKKYT